MINGSLLAIMDNLTNNCSDYVISNAGIPCSEVSVHYLELIGKCFHIGNLSMAHHTKKYVELRYKRERDNFKRALQPNLPSVYALMFMDHKQNLHASYIFGRSLYSLEPNRYHALRIRKSSDDNTDSYRVYEKARCSTREDRSHEDCIFRKSLQHLFKTVRCWSIFFGKPPSHWEAMRKCNLYDEFVHKKIVEMNAKFDAR